MFNVGDLIIGNERNGYGLTSDHSLCVVTEVRNGMYEDDIKVSIVAHANGDSYNGWVNSKCFRLCTYEEFMSKYPYATIVGSCSEEMLNEIKRKQEEETKKMQENLRMNKKKIDSYVLTDDERNTLRSEIISLLEEYDYHPTETGVNAILDEWIKNKGWMVNLFKKHPNYNGKFQISFDSDYNRVCDKEVLRHFGNWIYENRKTGLKEIKTGGFTYKEICKIIGRLDDIIHHMNCIDTHSGSYRATVNGKSREEFEEEMDRWERKKSIFVDLYNHDREKYHVDDNSIYLKKDYEIVRRLYEFSRLIEKFREHIATEEFAERVNGWFPSIKAVAGQKVSRIVGKVCKLTGLDKLEDYNREFAKYCDAINPLAIKRHTVISCHPIDYFTMSFGNSWASCHTIDKQNKRGMANDYSGCYSSGTLSYMLDESSFVYYTVDKEYNGDKLELEPKINRNMFHMGEDKLIQARVYPQATDGDSGIYKQIREIAQKVIADCLESPNLWKNVKGTGECRKMITSYGTHYRDYGNFDDCNVSYLKLDEGELINKIIINVGHNPICPKCGKEHDWEECVECKPCRENRARCSCCDFTYDVEDMHEIDGEWYCNDCCFYCEYHEQWELNYDSSIYINGYGRVCEDALNDSEYFFYCEHCGEWYNVEHCGTIVTEDGKHFCNESCARREGYLKTDADKWYPDDEVYYCEECGCYVHVSNWDDEHECCIDCVPKEVEEVEEVEEESEAV